MDLYAEEILDHYKHLRHFGHLDDPTLTYHDSNPFWWRRDYAELKIENDGVYAFSGHAVPSAGRLPR